MYMYLCRSNSLVVSFGVDHVNSDACHVDTMSYCVPYIGLGLSVVRCLWLSDIECRDYWNLIYCNIARSRCDRTSFLCNVESTVIFRKNVCSSTFIQILLFNQSTNQSFNQSLILITL